MKKRSPVHTEDSHIIRCRKNCCACFTEDDKQVLTAGMNIEPPCKWCSFQMFCRYA